MEGGEEMRGLKWWAVMLVSVMIPPLVAGCSLPSLIGSSEGVLIFCVINQTGQAIRVRVLADGQQLFTVEIDAGTEGSGQVPPPTDYPMKEVKVRVDSLPKVLEVQEMVSGRVGWFDVTGLGGNLGYRIVVTTEGIELSRDYVPIR